MRLLLATVISIGFAACNNGGVPQDGAVGSATARITQVPNGVGCVSITAVGDREVFHTFDVIPGQPATLQLGDLPVGNVAFSAAAYGQSCNAIGGAQPSWATTAPFVAAVNAGQLTSLTLTLEPTGGAVIGIDWGDGGAPPDLSGPPDGGWPYDAGPSDWDMAPCFRDGGCYSGGDGGDMAYPKTDLSW
jgi:hypothetical protein